MVNITIQGNLTKDVEIKNGKKGDFYVGSIAVSNYDKSTSFFNFIGFDKFGLEYVVRDAKKGLPCLVNGTLEIKDNKINVIAREIKVFGKLVKQQETAYETLLLEDDEESKEPWELDI